MQVTQTNLNNEEIEAERKQKVRDPHELNVQKHTLFLASVFVLKA